jgi:predicted DNA-binding transcriptional regulator AlpA
VVEQQQKSQLLKAEDIATMLGLRVQTIYTMARRGELEKVKLFRRCLRFRSPRRGLESGALALGSEKPAREVSESNLALWDFTWQAFFVLWRTQWKHKEPTSRTIGTQYWIP